MTDSPDFARLPEAIRARLVGLEESVDRILDAGRACVTLTLPKVAFQYDNIGHGPHILTPAHRAQSVAFVTRYQGLPPAIGPSFRVDEHGGFWLDNLDYFRHVVNDYRSLVWNVNDGVHFEKMHQEWRPLLLRESPIGATRVRVLGDDDMDVTRLFVEWLDQSKRGLIRVLNQVRPDLDYLYNGVLQHSDARLSERVLADYTSGEINCTFLKAASVLWNTTPYLRPYYLLAHNVCFPTPGPLPGSPAPAIPWPFRPPERPPASGP